MKGAGAPDLGTGAVQLGIIHGDRMLAAPPDRPFLLDQPQRLPFYGVAVPSAILGTVLPHPPARLQAKRRQNLRDGRLFPAQHHPCDSRPKPPPAWPGETCRKRPQQRVPPIPQLCSFAHDAPPLLSANQIWPSQPAGCLVGSVFARQNPRNYCLGGLYRAKPGPIDAEFAHSAAQCVGIDSQQAGCTMRTFDAAVGHLQGGFDMLCHRCIQRYTL